MYSNLKKTLGFKRPELVHLVGKAHALVRQ